MRAKVPEWDALMTNYGFDYEAYEVQTDDEWLLTLFRVKGMAGVRKPPSSKPPLLLMHGAFMDAASWVAMSRGPDPMPLQLATQGYDVWMGNNRGTRYSNINLRYP